MNTIRKIELTVEQEDMILDLAQTICFLRAYRELTDEGKSKVHNYIQNILSHQRSD